MAIQIIDNFNLSVAKPIDDRFVVGSQSFYTDKNDIPYKYSGLRVWDLNDGVPYYWDGSSWLSENSVSISGSGNANYVPKFIGSGSSTVLDDSCIYVSGLSVGINNTSVTAGYNLDVNGGIISQGATGFSGVGTLLTNLNASNISSGLLSLARLTNGSTTGHLLVAGASQPTYTNPYSITVGAASASTVVSDTSNGSVHYIGFFNGYSGNLQSRVSRLDVNENASIRQLTYRPSTGNLTSALMTTGTFSFGTGTSGSPAIRLSSVQSTGIYKYSVYGLGISTLGSEKLTINTDGIRHINNSFVSLSSFTVGTGTASSTPITISSAAYDRIIYIYSSSHSNAYYMTSGSFQIEASIGSQKIYSAFFGSDSGSKTVHNNHCYILPAGSSSTITLDKNNLAYSTGIGPTIYCTSLRFGL